MTKLHLDEKWLEGDKDTLIKNISKVERLILKNPFSERMVFLLGHQELATKRVPAVLGNESEPNCIGTLLWIAGLSKLDHPYHGYDSELEPHTKVEGDDWGDLFRVHPERKIPGALGVSYDYNGDCHTGIYLGEVKSTEVLFAQHGLGKRFGIETSRCYSNLRYYIPRTLRKN